MRGILTIGVVLLFIGLAFAPTINADGQKELIKMIYNIETNSEKENYNCTIIAFAKETFMRYPDDSFPRLIEIGEWLLDKMGQGFPPLILIAILYLFFSNVCLFLDAFIYPLTRWPLTLTFGKWIDKPSFPMLNEDAQSDPNIFYSKSPARGVVLTKGTNGIVSWAGMFWGDIGVINNPGYCKDFIGVEGFEGFKFSRPRNAYDVYIGKADHVKLTYKWPGWADSII